MSSTKTPPQIAPQSITEQNMPALLKTKDIAQLLGLNIQVVRDLCRRGEIPAVKIGRRFFVPTAKLYEYLGAEVCSGTEGD